MGTVTGSLSRDVVFVCIIISCKLLQQPNKLTLEVFVQTKKVKQTDRLLEVIWDVVGYLKVD